METLIEEFKKCGFKYYYNKATRTHVFRKDLYSSRECKFNILFDCKNKQYMAFIDRDFCSQAVYLNAKQNDLIYRFIKELGW